MGAIAYVSNVQIRACRTKDSAAKCTSNKHDVEMIKKEHQANSKRDLFLLAAKGLR